MQKRQMHVPVLDGWELQRSAWTPARLKPRGVCWRKPQHMRFLLYEISPPHREAMCELCSAARTTPVSLHGTMCATIAECRLATTSAPRSAPSP